MSTEKRRTSGSSTNRIIQQLTKDFQDPDVRQIYVEEFVNAKIATQIKVLREQRDKTQGQIAELAEMRQERISVLEDVNYEAWTMNVLRRLGRSFDLWVDVEFKEFGAFPNEFLSFSQEFLARRSFNDDPVFSSTARKKEFLAAKPKPAKRSVNDATAPQLAFMRGDVVEMHPADKTNVAEKPTKSIDDNLIAISRFEKAA